MSAAQPKPHASQAVWFEIPATDLERATKFYEALFDVSLRRETFGATELSIFPYERPAIGGALVKGADYRPGIGPIVYLTATPNLDAVLARVEAAGGSVVIGKTALPGEMGAYAHVRDTEGNTVGLHALS